MGLKLIILKFHFLKFLGRFIPYFKGMGMNEEKLLKCFDDELVKYVSKFNGIEGSNHLKIGNGQKIESVKEDSCLYEIKYTVTFKNVIDFYVYLEFSKNETVGVKFESIGKQEYDFFAIIQRFSQYMQALPFGNFRTCFKLLENKN